MKPKAVARIVEVDEDDDDDEDYVDTYKGAHKCIALAMQGYWKRWEAHKIGAPRPPRNKNFKKKGERPRTCYNCGSANHFVKESPFEQREENDGKLIRKDKAKAPQNKNFARRAPRALYALEGPVLETYVTSLNFQTQKSCIHALHFI